MEVATKKSLCVINTIMSAIAYLLLHATIWLNRSNVNATWVYLDIEAAVVFVPALVALGFAFGSCFWSPKNSKIRYIVAAVLSAIPAIIIIIIFACYGSFDKDVLVCTWRIIPATLLYIAVSAIYFAIAFTKIKEAKKQDEPIPYSE